MAETVAQTYANHRRFVPMYHFVAFGILSLNVLWTVYQLIRDFTFANVMEVLVAAALVVALLYARVFPLAAQDRVIRLEERLRLARLAPELEGRIEELSTGQLVALRFASDEELPELTKKVLDEGIRNREEIKKLVRSWRPDLQRV